MKDQRISARSAAAFSGQLQLTERIQMTVSPGIIQLVREAPALLGGQRVALLTHAAATSPRLERSVDALAAVCDLRLLFGPEHGLDGVAAAGQRVGEGTDRASGLRVISLYGARRAPAPADLAEIDLLVCDLCDIGARFYTYAATLLGSLAAAADAGVPVLLCDRPNPLGGAVVEGPTLRAGYQSLVGAAAVPIRHGLTLGELARMANARAATPAELQVLPAQGWRRAQHHPHTGLPWVPPSPNVPGYETALLYPGTCLIEGTNVSEGRGTALPFQQIGAPWLNGRELAAQLNALGLPGVGARATAFAPLGSKHAGLRCEGIQLHITDAAALRPVALGVHLLAALRRGSPEFAWLPPVEGARHFIDLLWGGDGLRRALDAREEPAAIIAAMDEEARQFEREREEWLLYE
jgi:uncharacterized protein YbbC (DUF1343 family)